ncbi:MAG: prepilin-type N-terminal cleavage/methylation domain-containing protein [Gemmatimonadaceae bacterium]|nr:prepilin-type N-terminal cleavage/methylation domain-containing protein [Gemmatimonadaceae bacterium]
MTPPVPTIRRGFTLVELLAAMTIGLLVLGAATSFAINAWITQSRSQASEDTTRRGRYLATSLQRDVGEVGVFVSSSLRFGSLVVNGDTIGMLRVPTRDTSLSPSYLLRWNVASPPAAGVGTCGTHCLEVRKRSGRVEIAPGDLFLIRDDGTGSQRVLLATTVNDPNPTDTLAAVRVTFLNGVTRLWRWPSQMDSTISVPNSTVQKLAVAVYYRDGNSLMRASSFNSAGQLVPELMAAGISGFEASVFFANGTQADSAFPGDSLRNFCQVASVRALAQLTTDRPADPRIANSALVTRPMEMTFLARNLVYQRNARRGRPCT